MPIENLLPSEKELITMVVFEKNP